MGCDSGGEQLPSIYKALDVTSSIARPPKEMLMLVTGITSSLTETHGVWVGENLVLRI